MKYFGTDGIRGEVGKSLPFERAFQLGFAIQKLYTNKKVMIAYDTRDSYLDFTYALLHGLKDSDVEVLGMFPTPVLAFESHKHHAIGIMITASHNPYTDNGLKVFEKGLKASLKTLEQLEIYMDEAPAYKPHPMKYNETQQMDSYLAFLKSLNFKDDMSQYTLFDCANGATSFLAPKLFHGDFKHNHPDGFNINLKCGSTYIENHLALSNAYDLIVTYDGDGDRMLAIIDGQIIYGDVLLYVFAKDDETKGIKHNVALSVMTNPGILKAFDDLDIKVYETPVGDAYIIDAIEQGLVTRGAEASGHILTEHITIGDGILASAKLFDMISRQGLETVKSWIAELKLYPMETKNVHINKSILKDATIQFHLEKIIKDVPKPGKVIVRASGTEDLVRITVSLETQEQVTSQIKAIESLLLGGKK
jgi:phosphoglucosamine mutase